MTPLDIKKVSRLRNSVEPPPPMETGFAPEPCSVRQAGLDAAIGDDDLAHLQDIAQEVNLPAGGLLFSEADPAASIYSVVDGTMRVCKMMPDGRRQITGFLTRGDFVGLADDDLYVYTAEAVSNCTLLRYPMDRLRRLLERYPEMERGLCAVARHELAEAQDHMLLLGRKTASERLAQFLLLRARREPGALDGEESILLPMTRGDIADHLGMATETVSRVFKRFTAVGLIDIAGKRDEIRLCDSDGLDAIAEGLAEEPD